MDNVTTISCCIALVFFGLTMFSLYTIYGGKKANLVDAKVGDVYNFEYLQPLNGKPERYLAKVIEPVATLDDSWIRVTNRRSSYRRNDPNFKRTNHLVTCQTVDGNIRQFYCERVINCRRPLLSGLVM